MSSTIPLRVLVLESWDDVSLEVFFSRGVAMSASSSWTLALTLLLVILVGLVFVQEIRSKLS